MEGPCITSQTFSRIGLLGNPSDGYQGKTISVSCANFWAEVHLKAANTLSFVPHPVHDLLEYSSLSQFTKQVNQQGYYGGIRLLQAVCKQFAEYCLGKGISLPQTGFALQYETNIPRQAGLSGSSAIACATLDCLLQHYNVADRIPLAERPQLILSAEAELGITAGLQDRVIQVYGGMMYMDFSNPGANRFERLPTEQLPPLWLVYSNTPSDSGAVHSPVKQRWLAGDSDIRKDMALVASLAEQGREALAQSDMAGVAALMDRNFDLRLSMFGEAALGEANLKMISLARQLGAAAKFTGSGGAAVLLCPGGHSQAAKLGELYSQEGFVMVKVLIGPALQ